MLSAGLLRVWTVERMTRVDPALQLLSTALSPGESAFFCLVCPLPWRVKQAAGLKATDETSQLRWLVSREEMRWYGFAQIVLCFCQLRGPRSLCEVQSSRSLIIPSGSALSPHTSLCLQPPCLTFLGFSTEASMVRNVFSGKPFHRFFPI